MALVIVLAAGGPVYAQGGLTPAERAEFYHTPEGSEIFPVDWLRAMTSVRTGKPFLDDLGRFGLIPDPAGQPVAPNDPRKLPVGVTLSKPTGSSMLMLGVNCAACHVAELHVKGAAVRVDGAPALFDIQTFYEEMFLSAAATVADERKLVAFLTVLRDNKPRDVPTEILVSLLPFLTRDPATRAEASFEALLLRTVRGLLAEAGPDHVGAAGAVTATGPAGVAAALREAAAARVRAAKEQAELLKELLRAAESRKIRPEALSLLLARVGFLKKIRNLQTYDGRVPRPGPGRVDAFTNARNFLFEDAEAVAPDAPVRYPILWGLDERWLHWDGNTNSVMERNVGQAMGVGAIADPRTLHSTLLPANLHRLEELSRKLTPPAWPKEFGPVSRQGAEYKLGAKLYAAKCAGCHERQEADGHAVKGTHLGVVYRVGTDEQRLQTFGLEMRNPKYDREFAVALGKRQKGLKLQSFADHGEELVKAFGPGFAGVLDLPEEKIVWQKTGGYVARPLAGAWATAPYLHNGSVPTLADLLEPATKRPFVFPVGHREYDPRRVGFVSRFEDVPAAEQNRVFVFDTRLPGNRNTGHEFGTDLRPKEKEALLVYLKGRE